jgi:hypothetical protein
MATKAQLARRLYGQSFDSLPPGKKARVTREFNEQHLDDEEDLYEDEWVDEVDGVVHEVVFGRPGINGTKSCLVPAGTTLQEALAQAGVRVNTSKEGVLRKSTGAVVTYGQPVTEGTYMIMPGVDSSF